MFPDAILFGHRTELDRISTSLTKHPLTSNHTIQVGNRKIEAIMAPGHTDSHMALWEPASGFVFLELEYSTLFFVLCPI